MDFNKDGREGGRVVKKFFLGLPCTSLLSAEGKKYLYVDGILRLYKWV
jgi:hypothetical protein